MAEVYRMFQDRLSLRGFCRIAGLPRWRLRYHLNSGKPQELQQARADQERKWVQEVALRHKTYGYRGIYLELNKLYSLGREKVRGYMAELGFKKIVPKRKRKPAPELSSICDLPQGRKVQIDATRVT